MNFIRIIAFTGLAAVFVSGCSGKGSEDKKSTEARVFPNYKLGEPSKVFVLPEELDEISGLAVISPEMLLANQDEEGILYFFSLSSETIEKKQKWGKKGDYEGAAIVGQTAYVSNSEGTIYQIGNFNSEHPEVQEFKNDSLKNCDVEGLTYLKSENLLLLACKEGSGKEEERRIYRFSLDSMALQQEPYRILRLEEAEDFLITTGLDEFSVNMKKFLDPEGESGILYPSGIAIHPITGDLFVLSAKSKLLLVYSSDGKLQDIAELNSTLFRQPESISFTANGDMYVGNEAKGEKATILKFEYVQE